MTSKLYFFAAALLLSIAGTALANSAADQCTAIDESVCMNCQQVGSCHERSDGSYGVTFRIDCVDNQVCNTLGGVAACNILSENVAPECMCSGGDQAPCKVDPYDDQNYVNCGNQTTRTYGECTDTQVYNEPTCSCEDASCPQCDSYKKDDGDCATFVICSGGQTGSGRCPDGLCYNELTCQCTDEPPCPVCGYRDDENSADPEKFKYCNTNPSITGKCPNGYDWNDAFCGCLVRVSQTTVEPFTTPQGGVDCDSCGYAPYPSPSNPECKTYYHCNDDGSVITETCPGTLCYDVALCACDIAQ